MSDPMPEVPLAFKSLQHYLKTGSEYEKRDPVVSYYCMLYAMQRGMEIDKKSPDCRNFLRIIMGQLENMKTQLKDNEAIQSELVGQAHIEDAAVKLFFYADNEDRKAKFDKNVVKAFYTSSMLFDVLTTFGPLAEELEKSRKYAKWKAAYIHNCLKVGATPTPGPVPEASEELGISADYQFRQPKGQAQPINPPQNVPQNMPPNVSKQSDGSNQPLANPHYMNQPINRVFPPHPTTNTTFEPMNQPSAFYPPTNQQPANFPPSNHNAAFSGYPQDTSQPVAARRQNNLDFVPQTNNAGFDMTSTTSTKLKPEDYAKAMKYCKFANSALQYEDAPTAIINLGKALKLLSTGSE